MSKAVFMPTNGRIKFILTGKVPRKSILTVECVKVIL